MLNLTQDTVREMLTSTNANEALAGVPPDQVAFAQGVLVKPNASYSLYGVSGLIYSGGHHVVAADGAQRQGLHEQERPLETGWCQAAGQLWHVPCVARGSPCCCVPSSRQATWRHRHDCHPPTHPTLSASSLLWRRRHQ